MPVTPPATTTTPGTSSVLSSPGGRYPFPSVVTSPNYSNAATLNRLALQNGHAHHAPGSGSGGSGISNRQLASPSLSSSSSVFVSNSSSRLYTTASGASISSSNTGRSRSGRSRRPSAVSALQSFLEGVEFATRCPSTARRRGESRSASRQVTDNGKAREALHSSASRRTLAEQEEGFISDDDEDFFAEGDRTARPESIRGNLRFQIYGDATAEEADEYGYDDIEDGRLDTEDMRVFAEGDRLYEGGFHDGLPVSNCFSNESHDLNAAPTRFEIIRKLGSGSYAVVYLCRAILSQPSDFEEDDYWIEEDAPGQRSDVVYGKEFALKCLCKRNLTDDLLDVQKFEATLHQSLPSHPNIVAMYGAFETDLWLFLVLEYCPGQDLFYWLEQARDHEDFGSHMHPSAAFSTLGSRTSSHATALNAEPSTLTTSNFQYFRDGYPAESHSATPPSPSLLSMTAMNSLLSRRRLRLISRMFAQLCEGVNACHVVGVSHRDLKPENIICCDEDAVSGLERRVAVKITDWGLGTRDAECGDFDCGSKPYMSYECRNNLGPSYRPREADIWSLGIILLNLLFHRCPWSDPTLDDHDFAAYFYNPVEFLTRRFEGMGSQVATYLATHILNCDGPRVSAHEFGAWVESSLVRLMSGNQAATAVSEATVPLVSSRPSDIRLSHIISQASSTRPSPRSSLIAHYLANNQSPTMLSPPQMHRELAEDFEERLKVDVYASPRRSGESRRSEEARRSSESRKARRSERSMLQTEIPELPDPIICLSPPTGIPELEQHFQSMQSFPERTDQHNQTLGLALVDTPNLSVEDAEFNNGAPTRSSVDIASENDAAALAAKAKRRKRGARKGRVAAKDGEPNTPQNHPGDAIDDRAELLARASQSLARELSSQPASAVADSRPPLRGSKTGGGLVGRFKALKQGNPDLEAFRQRVKDRDAHHYSGGTASAPAKMQHSTKSTGSATSSFGSVSSASWSAGGEDDQRSHWASTSNKRERLGRSHRSPQSTSTSNSSPSRMSSISSSNSATEYSASSASSYSASSYRSRYPAKPERVAADGAAAGEHHQVNRSLDPISERASPVPSKSSSLPVANLPPPVAQTQSAMQSQIVTKSKQATEPPASPVEKKNPLSRMFKGFSK